MTTAAAPALTSTRDVGGTAVPSAAFAGAVMASIVVIWGLGPPVTKLISAPALVGVSVRFWFSVPIIWGLTYATGHRISRQTLRATVLPGALFGLNLLCVFAALQNASVAVLAVIQALQPGVVLLIAGPLLGEMATRWHVSWTVVGVIGVVVVVLGGSPEVHTGLFGIALAIASLLTFTAYYLLNRRARSTTTIHPLEWMAGVTLFAALTVTPIALAFSSVDDYRLLNGMDWVYLAFIALFVGIFGHTMMSWAHRFIPASRSSLYLLAMNVVAISAAWPLHDEPITPVQALGGAIVLGAVAAVLSRPASVRVVDRPSPTAATSR